MLTIMRLPVLCCGSLRRRRRFGRQRRIVRARWNGFLPGRSRRALLVLRRLVRRRGSRGEILRVVTIGNHVEADRQHDEDAEDDARCPRQHVTGLRSKGGIASAAAERTRQSAPAAFLDQDEQDQKHPDDQKEREEDVKERSKHVILKSVMSFQIAALTIARKLSGFSAAPPINPPSTSLCDSSAFAFSGFMLPPYKIRTRSAKSLFHFRPIAPRMNACTSCACASVAFRPVPIAQTGSYAMTSRSGSCILSGDSSSSCFCTTASVWLASRSSSFSPTQCTSVIPAP